jgi:hypothetical protein
MKLIKKLLIFGVFFIFINQIVSPASAATLSQGVYHSTDSQTLISFLLI